MTNLNNEQTQETSGAGAPGKPPVFTLEQQQALALARARKRRDDAQKAASPATGGPWEKYQTQQTPQTGPWSKYQAADPWDQFPDSPSSAPATTGIEAELYDGTILEFPAGTDPQVIQRVVKQQTSLRRNSPQVPEATLPPQEAPSPASRSFGQRVDGLAAALFDGVRQGGAIVAGAPVDLINNAPRLANFLPGVDGVGPISDNPIGGRDTIDELLRGGGLIDDYQPQGGIERVANRIGEELGSTAVPVGAAVGKALTMPVQAVNSMAAAPRSLGQSVASSFLQPAAVAPGSLIGREAGYAVGGGMGALTSGASALVGAGRNAMAGATNSPNFADDVASSAVADRIINSSSDMQAQAARLTEAGLPPSSLTTEQLVQALRSPAAVEDAVPGYRANIADRTQDPGLATLAYNTDAVSPGAASARRVGNETAVNETITGLAPAADPDRFRTDLQAGVDNRIGEALSSQEAAQFAFDDILQAIQPSMREASARGSSIRSALSDAYSGAQDAVRQRYSQIDGDGTLMDPSGLVESARGVDANLAPNDAKRFRPPEADTIQEMMPGGRNPLRDTGLVNEFNRPVFAENGQSSPRGTGETLPSMPGETIGQPGTTVPMSDISAIRTGLTDDLRAAQAAGNTQQARVLSKYVDAVDGYLEENMSEGLRAALDDARAARRDVGERFERPGTALESVLARRQGGGFALDDSAVPSRIAQPDQGKLTDLRAALSEAGGDPRLREGLADEVRSSVMQNGLLNKPQALGRYMADRQVLLSEFPELRTQLQNAGASRTALAEAERVARDTTKRLTTPGRSAEASYLKQVEDPAAAIRSVTSSPDPRKAVADLVATAGTPQAKQDLRSALWEEVKRSGRLQADGMTGETRWNGKRLRALFDDPKFSAVADELWADDPQDLASIKEVFGALAGAEGSTRARAAGSSGTPQALGGGLDPALTASSIASRARSVSRGQLSPTIAGVDILGTWLRRRSAQVQSRAIDAITASVVNNPGMAADLLEKYNPATAAARRQMLTQKYGVRATTLLNIMDEAENDDPVLSAIQDQ